VDLAGFLDIALRRGAVTKAEVDLGELPPCTGFLGLVAKDLPQAFFHRTVGFLEVLPSGSLVALLAGRR
jgi:hypothetical protein